MKFMSLITHVLILTISVPHYATAGFSFKKVKSALGAKPFQEVIEKEYALESTHKKLVVENMHGNITIKTDWHNNCVALTATIHKAKEDESQIQIINDTTDKEFVLRTIADNATCKSTVDYVLIVPSNIKLQLSTGKGNITVNDAHGITMATTDSGTINFNNMRNKARATTLSSGSICCRECSGAVYATTTRGHIRISDVQNTVVAKTDLGKINVTCKELRDKSQLDLSSSWGNIAISLPENCDADIKAHTERGTCICEHYITLRPRTTKLNDRAWTQFKRSVDGTIGNGTVPVQISSVSSNIRIMTSKTS